MSYHPLSYTSKLLSQWISLSLLSSHSSVLHTGAKVIFQKCNSPHATAWLKFFDFTLLLGESQNHYHDFKTMHVKAQLTLTTSSNPTLSQILVFQTHLHCSVPWTNSPYILTLHFFFCFTHWWTFRLFACLVYCIECCNEHGRCIKLFKLVFSFYFG